MQIWEPYTEPKEEHVITENETAERKIDHKTVIITEVGEKDLTFFAQDCDKGACYKLQPTKMTCTASIFAVILIAIRCSGPQLEKMMEQLRIDMTTNPPLPGAYTPRRGDLCVAKYSDGEWLAFSLHVSRNYLC